MIMSYIGSIGLSWPDRDLRKLVAVFFMNGTQPPTCFLEKPFPVPCPCVDSS